MNKRQKLIVRVVNGLLDNEVWLYGRKVTSFYKMKKFVNKNKLV